MSDVDELVARADGWQRCIEARDVTGVLDYLDDDYALVLVQPTKSVVKRPQWIETLPDYIEHEYALQERVIDVDGDLGVVLQRVVMRATVLGNDRSGTFVLSDIWRRRDGAWRVWRRHSTPLTAGSLPVAPATTE